MTSHLARYPLSFTLRHPVRVARNVVGNHSSPLADRYLRGLRGVEIGGAAHNDFYLETINVDVTSDPSTSAAQRRYTGRTMPIDVVAPADRLPFADRSFDFVLASHVIEHVPDPIRGLREWARVARRYVYVIVPRRDNVFDRDRPLTGLDELIDRNNRGFTSDEETHWSIWTSETFSHMCEHIGLGLIEVQDPDDKRGNGFAVVLAPGDHAS